ncbi:hypothetical protein HPB48_001149 [Haemaphysalis longicornis]|uniref:Uncharacterized protein n=1 Tax=Haemaphysalis longicornis TaxID=44386 RepID=A0A9J6FI68_HAELO|nr:hypothetical protein HPB48_001149 [Haemaphysalis longicornis]
MTIKTTQKLSYPEAKRMLSFQQKGTFAEVVRRGPAPALVSVGTQVELRDLVSAVRPPPVPEAGLPQRPALTRSTQVDRVDRSADCSVPQPSTQVGPEAGVPTTDGVEEASGLTRSSAGSAPAARSAPPSRGTVDTPQKKGRREVALLQVRLLHGNGLGNPPTLEGYRRAAGSLGVLQATVGKRERRRWM